MPVNNLRITNSLIYFEGHNDNTNKYDCALKIFNAPDAVIENNTIITSLPLKEIDYTPTGANLDSEFVYSVGFEGCDGLLFNNNTIINEVNKRPAIEFPTQNCMMISKSDGVIISNNSIYMSDFVTYPGSENYIYGIDVHDLKDLWIVNNTISMVTSGGKLALGTAYPIQISGPASGVNIEYNDLYSFSNGPNIGIYSQCYYGETYISIKNNKINVTGLAGTHDWALVTGIESQDTFAEILNNQIEVHSIAEVGRDDNLYAISYRQSISGPNTFDIENNVAMTDGFYAVYVLGSSYSTIAGNTLISFNKNVATGDDAYMPGFRSHYSEDNYDNRVIGAIDYFSALNEVNNGNIIDVGSAGGSNDIDTSSFSGRTQSSDAISNPLIPGFKDLSGITNKDNNDYNGFIDDGSIQDTISENQNNANDNFEGENTNVESVDVSGNQNGLGVLSNSSSSSASVGVSNNPLNGAESSAGGAKSVSKKAYEIEEMMKKEEFIPSTFFVLATLFLLIVGYGRKREYVWGKKMNKYVFFTVLILGLLMSLSCVNALDDNTTLKADSSLHNLIVNAKDNDTIYLDNITYDTDEITIDKSLNFIGQDNTIIDGKNSNSLFIISDNVKVSFKNIKFVNASKTGTGSDVYGAALEIRNADVLIDNCQFISNSINYGSSDYIYGASISNMGNLSVLNSYFYENSLNSGYMHEGFGGAIYNNGFLYVDSTSFVKSRGGEYSKGAVIYNDNIALINNSIIADTYSFEESMGSAIFNNANMTLLNSRIENNTIERKNFNFIYGNIFNSGFLKAQANIFKNNTAYYRQPNSGYEGCPTIYNVGDLDLSYNAFIDNVGGFAKIYRDVFLNGGKSVTVDDNWWGDNTNPFTTQAINVDMADTWLVLDVT